MHDLTLTRLIDAPRDKLFRCWTDPELIPLWFCPPPWGVSKAEVDLRPGGSCLIVMRGPEGQEMPNPGVYLEVVPNEKLVFTDAFTSAWEPSEKPFMTGILTFADEAGKTRYTATVRHWTAEDKAQHEAMGFHEGWGIATDQLEALAKRI
ncbi:SRPBCC family protein [Rhizorhabdus wittichii]|uniref:Activator of Hsp90 ATPase 1 family protein n=2 Tax=Rhizorhabdus wittichii TaxID=160791 RepID=A0A9J9LCV9_RHIWR|nr:SRPBCC family protein [Rhizorhabdus wittichii]ABQ67474.1 Activator of Hsp90 ATPase 1 family protein [Rhizorhabdus wittichii RW1]ARR55750.1 polyketide cyclase [Rhizorhabdus wittichii DC-6]QTH22124.1 SRPBCC family protein [Rhizorhabdus wittichii]